MKIFANARLNRALLYLGGALACASVSASPWYFRGTPNGWGKTQLEALGNHKYETCQVFVDSNPQFKIDHKGTWQESYPARNYSLGSQGSYKIGFTSTSHQITVKKVASCTPSAPGFFEPYIGPYLTLLKPDPAGSPSMLDPTTSMVVNYELQSLNSNFTALVNYRAQGAAQWLEQQEDEVAPLPSKMGKVHHISLTDLTPDTTYEYKVVGPNGDFSETYSFKTAKTDMDYSRFLVIGDMQDNNNKQRWDDVAQEIVDAHMDEFDFIIGVGDLVSQDKQNEFYWWKVFFDKGQELFASKPLLPTIGNHDTPANPTAYSDKYCNPKYSGDKHRDFCSNAEDTTSFRKYFYLSPDMNTPDYYSFAYGNACFISLNTEIPVFYKRYESRDSSDKAGELSNWVEDELNAAQSCAWSFAYSHVPPINPAGHKDEPIHVSSYTELFNHKLDWMFSGHVHQYQRLKPIISTADGFDFKSTYGRGAPQGVGYIVAPPAGAHPRNKMGNNMHQLAMYPKNDSGDFAREVGFIIVNVADNDFDLKTYGMGTLRDHSQASNYRSKDEEKYSKQLLDEVAYSKVAFQANAGRDVEIHVGQSVTFDASASYALNSEIVSYAWSNGLTGVNPTKVYDAQGTYEVSLTVTDAQGNQATDTVIVTVSAEPIDYKHVFAKVDFRGTFNGWEKTPMKLVDDYAWQIDISVTQYEDNPRFKFYANHKWYGDSNRDGETHSSESSSIKLTQGAGNYRITLIENTRKYKILKL